MSRSGYSDECEYIELYRANVERAINGKRGQAFLAEMAAAMDAMPEKKLIAGLLIDETGSVCAIGSVCKARGLDVKNIDYDDAGLVARALGIATPLAAEIEDLNDEEWSYLPSSPEQRWIRMRSWIQQKLKH